MEQIAATVSSYEFYLDATLLVAIAGVVWTFARKIAQEMYFRLSVRTRVIEFSLEAKEGVPENIKSLNMLFVRYGNDTYLSTLASDQERYHGRLRNKVVCIANGPKPDGGSIQVRLRVHKRLGTQFKFFVDVEGDPDPVTNYLTAHETISDVFCKERPKLRPTDIRRYRIFFLINRFDQAKTVEGFVNNFFYPI